MDAREDFPVWINLDRHLMNQILLRLSIPVLLQLRSVCKTWKERIDDSTFRDMFDSDDNVGLYMFMWRKELQEVPKIREVVSPRSVEVFTFLDLESSRWYRIPSTDLHGNCDCARCDRSTDIDETRLMECHNGLVSELTTIAPSERISSLILSDPISKIRKTLRNLPEISLSTCPDLNVVTVVDHLPRSYQVFLFTNIYVIGHGLKVHIYDSRTRRWRSLDVGTLRNGKVDDVIGFEDTVVAVEKVYQPGQRSYHIRLFKYIFEPDAFKQIWEMKSVEWSHPVIRLVARGNRLFLVAIMYDGLLRTVSRKYLKLEVHEVLIEQRTGLKPEVKLTNDELPQINCNIHPYSLEQNSCAIDAHPYFGVNGQCNSLVLVNKITSDVVRYNMATRRVDLLLTHPLIHDLPPHKRAYLSKCTKLKFKNLRASNHLGWILSP